METQNTNPYSKIQTGFIIFLGIGWFVLACKKGPIVAIDTINHYSPWADALIKYNFNIIDYINNTEGRSVPLLSYFWAFTIALNKLLLGENWGYGIITLNVLAGVLNATLLFNITWSTTKNPACSIFAGLALVLCYDIHQWMPLILGDTLYSAISFSVFFLILSVYQQSSNTQKCFVGIAAITGVGLFFRHAGLILLLFVILSLLLIFVFELRAANATKRHRFIRRLALSLCLILPAVILCHSYVMFHPEVWPFPFLKNWLFMISQLCKQGIIIYARPETYHFPPSNLLDMALVTLNKLAALFYISVKAFSLRHTLGNYIFFLPVYALSIFSIVQLFKKENGPSSSIWQAIFLCVFYIFFIAFFTALNNVDFDLRYRVYFLLPLVLLATLGLHELVNKFSKKI